MVIKQLKRKKRARKMSIPSEAENKTGHWREDLCNINRGCATVERDWSRNRLRRKTAHRRRAERRLEKQQEKAKGGGVLDVGPQGPHAGRTLN